ncbi:MAG: KH domain-containing protein, partial [Clostridiales bacterium]|nr:KH domain-containing protein [Clostridiales bacterium]
MQELLLFIAQSLVDDPDQVTVEVNEEEQALTLTLSVAQEDMGKVIGKQGRIAKAIRTVIRAASMKEGKF